MRNYSKRLLIKILIILLFLCAVVISVLIPVLQNQKREDKAVTEYVHVNYVVDDEQCEIMGEKSQFIGKGGDAAPITIIPKLGYYFLGWATAGNQDECFDNDKFTRQEKNVQEDIWLIAKFIGPVNSYAIFRAGKGGTVEGKLEQEVIYGGKGERVTAIPDEGYRFVKWSDGETEAVRENQSLCNYGSFSPDVYAEFERYSRKFEYVYNQGISEEGETNIEINLDNIDTVKLPVPTREECKFEGWYSDWHHEVKVTDENGEMLVGREWLDNDELYYYSTNPEGYLYAKWSTENKLPNYKILMVYITEVHGDFYYFDSNTKEIEELRVDYVMTEKHRKICNIITEFMSKYLNAIFNETVRFQVDEYFTVESVTEKQFCRDSEYHWEPELRANNRINEIDEIKKEYDSVMVSYSLCGFKNDLKLTGNLAGSVTAGHNEAQVVLDWVLRYFQKEDMDELLNYSKFFRGWESHMEAYIHEFIHTLENKAHIKDNVGLHSALSYYSVNLGGTHPNPYNVNIPFLLNKFEVGKGEYWGVPPEFWLNYLN